MTGITKLMINQNPEIIKTPAKGNKGALQTAIRRSNIAIAEALINGGIDINQEDDNGRTAIHTAATANKKQLVRLLL